MATTRYSRPKFKNTFDGGMFWDDDGKLRFFLAGRTLDHRLHTFVYSSPAAAKKAGWKKAGHASRRRYRLTRVDINYFKRN